MVIVQRKFQYYPGMDHPVDDELEIETFESWGDAFLYLERKIGPLDHETRRRAQRMGSAEFTQYEKKMKFGRGPSGSDEVLVHYKARFAEK